MNKDLKIIEEGIQEVTELDTWTLRWEIQGNGYDSRIIQHRAFTKKEYAEEFEQQLKESAKFIGTWVETKITKN